MTEEDASIWAQRGEVRLRIREAMPTIAERSCAETDRLRIHAMNWLMAYRRQPDANSELRAEVEELLRLEGQALGQTLLLADNPIEALASFLGATPRRAGRPPANDDELWQEVHYWRSCGRTVRDAISLAMEQGAGDLAKNRTEESLRKAYQKACRHTWKTLQASAAFRHIEAGTMPSGKPLRMPKDVKPWPPASGRWD